LKQLPSSFDLCMVGDSTLNERYKYLKHAEKDLDEEIHQLKQQMAFLKFKEWYYQTAIDAGTESIHFLPDINDFDPKTKREYLNLHPEETDFAPFVD
jgi:hypothetical protein